MPGRPQARSGLDGTPDGRGLDRPTAPSRGTAHAPGRRRTHWNHENALWALLRAATPIRDLRHSLTRLRATGARSACSGGLPTPTHWFLTAIAADSGHFVHLSHT